MMPSNFTFKTFVILILSCLAFSCKTAIVHSAHPAKGLPPGQAKKVYGQQSAKAFAPGQQKKRGNETVVTFKAKNAGKSKKKK